MEHLLARISSRKLENNQQQFSTFQSPISLWTAQQDFPSASQNISKWKYFNLHKTSFFSSWSIFMNFCKNFCICAKCKYFTLDILVNFLLELENKILRFCRKKALPLSERKWLMDWRKSKESSIFPHRVVWIKITKLFVYSFRKVYKMCRTFLRKYFFLSQLVYLCFILYYKTSKDL